MLTLMIFDLIMSKSTILESIYLKCMIIKSVTSMCIHYEADHLILSCLLFDVKLMG